MAGLKATLFFFVSVGTGVLTQPQSWLGGTLSLEPGFQLPSTPHTFLNYFSDRI
jgi:hypothetical protein